MKYTVLGGEVNPSQHSNAKHRLACHEDRCHDLKRLRNKPGWEGIGDPDGALDNIQTTLLVASKPEKWKTPVPDMERSKKSVQESWRLIV
jgi:hypothetical protein